MCVGRDMCLRVRENENKHGSLGSTCMTLSKTVIHSSNECSKSCTLTMSPSTTENVSNVAGSRLPYQWTRRHNPYTSLFLILFTLASLLFFFVSLKCNLVKETLGPQ